jgi:hypothetical protein
MRKLILVLSIVVGLAAAAMAPLLGGALAAMAWIGRARASGNESMQAATLAAGALFLSLAFGLALAWAGWAALRGWPARPFRLPRWGWWLLALAVTLGLGQAAFSAGIKALVPAAHIAAGVLPAFLFLSLALGSARRAGGAITARPMIGSIAWGGLGGAGLALTLELVLVLSAVAALAISLEAMAPELMSKLQAGALEFQRSGELRDLSEIVPYLTSPLVMLGILGAIAVIVPLLEEGVKSLAVPLVALAGRRLTRLDGFLLGVAAGAGFALFEGVMNGVLALSVPGDWALLMAVRAGTAAVHCAATGLAGLGWQAVLVERRWARGVGLGAAAVALHGAWNFFAGVQAVSGLRSLGAAGSEALRGQSLLVLLLLGTVWVGAALLLALLPRRLAGSAPVASRASRENDEGVSSMANPEDRGVDLEG